MPTVWTEVEVDVELSDIDTEDLIEELESRGGVTGVVSKDILQEIHDAYILGRAADVDRLLKELFYESLGRIVLVL